MWFITNSLYPVVYIQLFWFHQILSDCTAQSLPLVKLPCFPVNVQRPSSFRNNTTCENQFAHTPLVLCWRLGCSACPVSEACMCVVVVMVGGLVSVRARGLCDISRLPIWLGEWTPSNYSCSYCLINLPVSLLHPLNTHSLSFFPSSSAKEQGKKQLSGRTPQNTTEIPEKAIR